MFNQYELYGAEKADRSDPARHLAILLLALTGSRRPNLLVW